MDPSVVMELSAPNRAAASVGSAVPKGLRSLRGCCSGTVDAKRPPSRKGCHLLGTSAEEFFQPGADRWDSASGEVGKKQDADTKKPKTKRADKDRAQTLHLRKVLNHLDMVHEEKDLFIQKTRGELRACRQRIDLITRQQEAMMAEIDAEKEANNIAAVGRLQAAYSRLCMELDNERDLQLSITSTLKENENAMWHIEILEGQMDTSRKALKEEESACGRHLQARAAEQLHEEKMALRKAEWNRLLRIRKSVHVQKEHGLRHQKLVEDAQRNHKIAIKFLKASLGRIREREQKEEMESREHLKRRMDAVLALKNNITANRETLRKFQAWGHTRAELTKRKTQVEKEAILAQGGDAFKHLFHQRRRQELEAQKRAFEEEQKQRRLEIVNRLLKEEAEENRRKKPLPAAQTTDRLTLRDKTWCYVADFFEGLPTMAPSCPQDVESSVHPEVPQLLQVISSDSMQSDPGAITNPEEETLAQPEILGLWNEDYKPYQVPKEDAERKPIGKTKMEKDILAHTMERLRSGMVHKQVVSGREFKGCPFNSKPKLIHFKDFDIGKMYKKKITLINATYTINYCKLVGVEEHLRDFIHIDFDPPGPMSAGMSCEVFVTFKPMVNKDLEGNVTFLAQTGGFSVPLKCSTKKCSLSLDKNLIDFGSYVVGETTSRVITLTNVGGLGTEFKFQPIIESCEQSNSMKDSSSYTYDDNNIYEKIVRPSISENLFEVPESLPGETGKTESKETEEGHHAGRLGVSAMWSLKGLLLFTGKYLSKAALRLRFEVCKELREHMELLPETGYIQALSTYTVQLKFLPRHSLPKDAGKFFDKETRVLEAPMTIWVADQIRPVEFIVHAIVTTSDLEINPSEVDFGYCTIYEAIKTEVTLHNHSLLPQEFGFVRLPKDLGLPGPCRAGKTNPTLITKPYSWAATLSAP
ncbi:PREDICTED: uncharacterized protein KIAA1751 homolog [Chrysochloris asiatica]|uniref:Uncharacterized protein KIAA1751 homolog n=1 Tax=Chrysochloris asiatica TaxID=185453 RepID=A0A9B0TW19_CHRAS|nr:PREDICTED: uncharacterized protein KIAA1751 homolog [Chrysochloris asiatica]